MFNQQKARQHKIEIKKQKEDEEKRVGNIIKMMEAKDKRAAEALKAKDEEIRKEQAEAKKNLEAFEKKW